MKRAVFTEDREEVYFPNNYYKCMTVGELAEFLKHHGVNVDDVIIENDKGYICEFRPWAVNI